MLPLVLAVGSDFCVVCVLLQVLSPSAHKLGLILASRMTGGENKFQFSHLSLQEYVAALYLAQCIQSQGIDVTEAVPLLREPRGRLTMLWRFLTAILPSRLSTILLRDIWLAMMETCKYTVFV